MKQQLVRFLFTIVLSLLIRERGLKQIGDVTDNGKEVAPYTGAWIETLFRLLFMQFGKVAPCTEAWIETQIS